MAVSQAKGWLSSPGIGGKHQFMKKGSLKVRIPNPHQSDVDASLLKLTGLLKGLKPLNILVENSSHVLKDVTMAPTFRSATTETKKKTQGL